MERLSVKNLFCFLIPFLKFKVPQKTAFFALYREKYKEVSSFSIFSENQHLSHFWPFFCRFPAMIDSEQNYLLLIGMFACYTHSVGLKAWKVNRSRVDLAFRKLQFLRVQLYETDLESQKTFCLWRLNRLCQGVSMTHKTWMNLATNFASVVETEANAISRPRT